MSHFYVRPEDIKENIFAINGKQAHYVSDVRRFKTADEIMIFEGMGNSYKAKITSVNKNKILGNILSHSYKISDFIVKLHINT